MNTILKERFINSAMGDRQDLRNAIKTKLENLTQQERLLAAKQATSYLLQKETFSRSKNIACYSSKKSELDTQFILQEILRAGKNCYLPITQIKTKTLKFISYDHSAKLIKSHFNILEPIYDKNKTIPPCDLDLVIVPLVVYDLKGNRIGTGGGYYDRTFAFINKTTLAKKPLLYGLAFSIQYITDIQAESHDVPLQGVITDKGVFSFGS